MGIFYEVANMKKKGLTPKQLMFCHEYMKDLNATQAAIRAGYSAKTANVTGPQNLVKPSIQSKIKELLDVRKNKAEHSADEVIQLLWKMAKADLRDYMTVGEDGEVQAIAFDNLPEGATKLISKIKERSRITESAKGDSIFRDSTLEYELPEKLKAVELLMRHYGLINDKLHVKRTIADINNMTEEELLEIIQGKK